MILARRLFWRIYATLLASLLLAALLTGVLWSTVGESPMEAWWRMPVRLLEAAVPPDGADPAALTLAAQRLAAAIAGDVTLLAHDGHRLAVAGADLAKDDAAEDGDWDGQRGRRVWVFRLQDGRRVLARFGLGIRRPGWHIVLALVSVALAVGLAAWPIVARMTYRLEQLRQTMAQWGGGDLTARAAVQGQDEIAAVAMSFNRAAQRIDTLLAAHRALLANASHELRAPLARLQVATDVWQDAPSPMLRAEMARNLAELDQLIGEILLASRLDHQQIPRASARVDLLALAAEEAARAGASVSGRFAEVAGDARLLRRLLRNLLDNATRHGAPPIEVEITPRPDGGAEVRVLDRGPGVPEAERTRVFAPFYRPAGHGEAAGGWGLGLALVRQIAEQHGGQAWCEARAGGGSVFGVQLAAHTQPAA